MKCIGLVYCYIALVCSPSTGLDDECDPDGARGQATAEPAVTLMNSRRHTQLSPAPVSGHPPEIVPTVRIYQIIIH
jgi:hypothetical protein